MNQWETKNVSKPYLLPPVLSFWNADKTLVFCADDPFNASVFNPASREEEEVEECECMTRLRQPSRAAFTFDGHFHFVHQIGKLHKH